MICTEENDAGELWTRVMVNGKTGYIKTEFLNALTEEDSAEYDKAQKTPAPVYSQEEFFPTEKPTEVVTFEVTEEPEPPATPAPEETEKPAEEVTEEPEETEKPAEEATEEPEGTEKPTEEVTEEPEETDKPVEEVTEEPEPTEEETEAPTDTPKPTATPTPKPVKPTEEPYPRVGYAITIGDGVPFRKWPTASSKIKSSLPANKIVYVNGQQYTDGEAWAFTECDDEWGYVRMDMLRMIPDGEIEAYKKFIDSLNTPEPEKTPSPYVYDPYEMSCYGYVTTDAVNFRAEASSSSKRIRLMKKYALFIVYDKVQADGEEWYRVSYNNQIGYVNGRYFKQMTVSEAEEFLNSSKYQQGLANNRDQVTDSGNNNSSPTTTGTPDGIVTAEDQKVSEWKNPDTGSTVEYEPFDPFATPEPLAENELEKNDFIKSMISRVEAGTLKADDLQTELEKYYKDAKDPENSVKKAMEYLQEKLNLKTEEVTDTPAPLEPVEPENPQEKTSGGSAAGAVVAALALLGAAGGGGYYWYVQKQRKREAAQRMARQRAARQQQAMGGKEGAGTSGQPNTSRTASSRTGSARPASARPESSQPSSGQNATRMRTGSYTGDSGTDRPRATPSTPSGTQSSGKTYGTGNGTRNPYRRYSSSETDGDASYTASFKPNGGKDSARRGGNGPDDGMDEA